MTEPSRDDIRSIYPPESQFVFKLLDKRIGYPASVDDEQFKDKLKECGLLEEYEELEKNAVSREDVLHSLTMNWLGFSFERREIDREHKREMRREFFRSLRRTLFGRRRTSSAEQLPKPPALGEALIVLFCSKNRARYVMGCLEENFHEHIRTKGKRRAKLLYWAAVLHSIGPLLWVKLRRAGLIALLLEIGRRWSGLS
jgi:hypothetical protein